MAEQNTTPFQQRLRSFASLQWYDEVIRLGGMMIPSGRYETSRPI